MRILLVNRNFGEEQAPTGRMLGDVATDLAAAGHSVRVLTSRSGYNGKGGPPPSEPAFRNVSTTYLWTPPEQFRTLAWIAFLLQAVVIVPLLNWDRCLLLTDPPFLVTAAILAKLGGPSREVYWWTMDLYPESLVAHGILSGSGLAHRLLRALNNRSMKSLDGIVCLDKLQMHRLLAYPALSRRQVDIHVISPWAYRSVPEVSRSRNRFLRRYGLQGAKVALYAGNLGQAHTFSELLSAASALANRGDAGWRIVFVVRGARKAALEREAAGMQNVLVVDYQPLDWTADLLAAADVHLITMRSGWEGIVVPSKLYSVLSTRRPVLFIGPAACGTAQRIRADDEGDVLPPGSSGTAVADALLRLGRCGEIPPPLVGRKEAAGLVEIVARVRVREKFKVLQET